MKKLNKYDLTDSQLKRAYDFINAAYLKRNYDNQFSERNISQNQTPTRGVVIEDYKSRNENIKQNLEPTPKRKIVSRTTDDEKIKPITKPEKKPKNKTSSKNSNIVKNWLIIYDYSKLLNLNDKTLSIDALNQAKINGQYYVVANADDIEVTTKKESFITMLKQLEYTNKYSNLYRTAINIKEHLAELKQRKINALLYIGYDSVHKKKEKLEQIIKILSSPPQGLKFIESKFIIMPDSTQTTSCKYINEEQGPDFICATADQLFNVIQSFI